MLAVLVTAFLMTVPAWGQTCRISYGTKTASARYPAQWMRNADCPVNSTRPRSGTDVSRQKRAPARMASSSWAGVAKSTFVTTKVTAGENGVTAGMNGLPALPINRISVLPIATLSNDADGRKQKTARTHSVNTHGSGILSLTVSCPVDADGDHYPDEGGCEDALDHGFDLLGHRMELWELDHWRPWDDHVGTMYSPTLSASGNGTNCDTNGCDAGPVGSYRSKLSGTSAVLAKAAVRVTAAWFSDEVGLCCDPLEDPTCD